MRDLPRSIRMTTEMKRVHWLVLVTTIVTAGAVSWFALKSSEKPKHSSTETAPIVVGPREESQSIAPAPITSSDNAPIIHPSTEVPGIIDQRLSGWKADRSDLSLIDADIEVVRALQDMSNRGHASAATALARLSVVCSGLDLRLGAASTLAATASVESLDQAEAIAESAEEWVSTCSAVANTLGSVEENVKRAAELGDIESMRYYGTHALAGLTSIEDAVRDSERISEIKRTALGFLNTAIAQGDGQSLVVLGQLYRDGVLVESDTTRAAALFYVAAEFGGQAWAAASASALIRNFSLSDRTRFEHFVAEYSRCCR